MILSHIGAVPVEELLALAPAAVGVFIAAAAGLRSRFRSPHC
jgi:hypothetical protein